ncbi:DNA-directed RNA polymerase subunit omega [bacterium]|nr:DNA-directed RNA polymerase subunit omega [bacterium]
MNKNKEGLRYPSIDDLLTKIDSKYKLAYTAAKRAKIIKEEEYSSMEELGGSECATPVGMALEEILNEKVHVEFKDTAEDAKPENTFGTMEISGGSDDDNYDIEDFTSSFDE